MRDYIKNSKQVDMFLGSIDPVIIGYYSQPIKNRRIVTTLGNA